MSACFRPVCVVLCNHPPGRHSHVMVILWPQETVSVFPVSRTATLQRQQAAIVSPVCP